MSPNGSGTSRNRSGKMRNLLKTNGLSNTNT
jgi:hypothetical protein